MFKNKQQYLPIIFCDNFPHDIIAKMILSDTRLNYLNLTIASAGFIDANFHKTYGASSTLSKRSRIQDANILDTYGRNHGLRPLYKPNKKLDFDELVQRFQKLSDVFGISKSISFGVELNIEGVASSVKGRYNLTLGTYDIGDYPKRLTLGPFPSMNELLIDFERMVIVFEELALLEKDVY